MDALIVQIGVDAPTVTFDVPYDRLKMPLMDRLSTAASGSMDSPFTTAVSRAVIGKMTIRYKDGHADTLILYIPFGTVEYKQKVLKADLHELKSYIDDQCKQANRLINAQL